MTDLCKKLDEFKTPCRLLISSFYGHQIMVATPLLHWYDKHGLVIDKITAFIRYEPVPCLKDFTKEIANTWRVTEESKLEQLKATYKNEFVS